MSAHYSIPKSKGITIIGLFTRIHIPSISKYKFLLHIVHACGSYVARTNEISVAMHLLAIHIGD